MKRSITLLTKHMTSACLCTLLVLQSCSSARNSTVVLEFRPAERKDTRSECKLPELVRDTSVAMPAGGSVEVRFAARNPIELEVTSGTKLVFRDITSSNPAGTQSIEAVVFPEEPEANRIKAALRGRPGCYWLVTLRGQIVQLDFPGERGDGGISGGIFSSLDAALLAYGRAREDVLVEVESASEGTRVQEFWDWRRRMDLWEVACNPEFQEHLRKNDPKTFERLSETLKHVDCSAKPIPPPNANGSRLN